MKILNYISLYLSLVITTLPSLAYAGKERNLLSHLLRRNQATHHVLSPTKRYLSHTNPQSLRPAGSAPNLPAIRTSNPPMIFQAPTTQSLTLYNGPHSSDAPKIFSLDDFSKNSKEMYAAIKNAYEHGSRIFSYTGGGFLLSDNDNDNDNDSESDKENGISLKTDKGTRRISYSGSGLSFKYSYTKNENSLEDVEEESQKSKMENLALLWNKILTDFPEALFVVSAGDHKVNYDDNCDKNHHVPSCFTKEFSNIISVAATTRTHSHLDSESNEEMKGSSTIAPFSNFGRNSVQIAAPGGPLLAESPSLQKTIIPVTPFAASIVAKTSARIKDINPTLSPKEVLQVLKKSARKAIQFADFVKWSGELDEKAAIALAKKSIRNPEILSQESPDDNYSKFVSQESTEKFHSMRYKLGMAGFMLPYTATSMCAVGVHHTLEDQGLNWVESLAPFIINPLYRAGLSSSKGIKKGLDHLRMMQLEEQRKKSNHSHTPIGSDLHQ